MRLQTTEFRNTDLNKWNTDIRFKCLKWLFFWPLYGIVFYFQELFYPVENYHVVHCFIDDMIPFCEWFIFPYIFWFIYLIGMLFYTLFWDKNNFFRMMKFIMFTYLVTTVIYFIYPTCQNLRPGNLTADNFAAGICRAFYKFDTNTNVCPSIHVIGSVAVWGISFHIKKLSGRVCKWLFAFLTVIICISTLFVKQHSVLDLIAAAAVCAAGWLLFYRKSSICKK